MVVKYLTMVALPFIIFSCTNEASLKQGDVLVCNAETLNKKATKFKSNIEGVLLSGGAKQTNFKSRSGECSVYTIAKKAAFAFSVKLVNIPDDTFLKVSVWRKSKNGNGTLVASAQDPDNFYKATSRAVETDVNGWEKLELKFYTIPLDEINGTYSFYVWNRSSTDTVYFDDFKIERVTPPPYPYIEDNVLRISLDTSKYIKLLNIRKKAFKNHILQTSDNDWVKGLVFSDTSMMKVKLRLKGDWLDHLEGNKWSYRVKLKGDNSWNHLKVFSLQTPKARNFLYEWGSHKLYDAVGNLTTRYGFVNLFVNNVNRGIYAWEEHFRKQLLESRNRREGVIVKFDENPFWQITRMKKEYKKELIFPYFQTSDILPFSESKVLESNTLYNQFLNAQKLLTQYKNGHKPASSIFDLDKLASYYAMLDLTHAKHGMAWHNQRFYYNPIIGKLEPIAFDGYTENSTPKLTINDNNAYLALKSKNINPEQLMFVKMFYQKDFTNKYLYYLQKYSDEKFIDSLLSSFENEAKYYDSLLKLEFINYNYDFDFYKKSAKHIRQYLPELKKLIGNSNLYENNYIISNSNFTDTTVFDDTPEYFVNAFKQKENNDSVTIKIFNYFTKDITILGTSSGSNYVTSFQSEKLVVPKYNGIQKQSVEIKTDSGANNLFFMVDGHFDTYKTIIHQWPSPKGITVQQELSENINLADYDIISKIVDHRIYLKNGNFQIGYNLVFPSNYKVYISEGTVIDLIDSAMIISYSPVFINGTKKRPVVIKSSDFTANGFTILQAKGRSELKYVSFENLNTLNYKSWTLTGALTFYESDVDLDHVTFYRNQCEDALNIVRSDFKLTNSSFNYIYGDAFDSDFSKGLVEDVKFTNIGNDAIDFSGSKIFINRTSISGAEDKGVSGGEDSHLTVKNCFIEKANIGIASKDLSTVEVVDTKIVDCNYGLVLLQKKPEYGPAEISLQNVDITNAKTEKLIEKGSVVKSNGKTIYGKELNVAARFY